MLATYLGNVQVCHVVELLLGDRMLAQGIVFDDTGRYDAMLIIIMVLVAYTYFLVIVSVCWLTLLISDDWDAVNTGYTTLPVNQLLVLLLVDVEVLTGVQIEFFFWIKSIKILKISGVKGVLKTLFKSANDIEVLLVFSELSWSVLAHLLYILLIVKIDDFWITLLGWQLVIHIRCILISFIFLPCLAAVGVCGSRADAEAISNTIHWRKSQFVCQLVVVYIWEWAITLIIQCL